MLCTGPWFSLQKSDAQVCVSNRKYFSMFVDLAKCQRTTTVGFEDKLQSEPLFSLRKHMSSTCFPTTSNQKALV